MQLIDGALAQLDDHGPSPRKPLCFMTENRLAAYILVLPPGRPMSLAYGKDGQEKKTWFIRLPRGIDDYSWDHEGEEGEKYGRSVKSEDPKSSLVRSP